MDAVQTLITGAATVISVLSGVVAVLYRERTKDLTERVKGLEDELKGERGARLGTAEGYTRFALDLHAKTAEQLKHVATVAEALNKRDGAAIEEAVRRSVEQALDVARESWARAVAEEVRRRASR